MMIHDRTQFNKRAARDMKMIMFQEKLKIVEGLIDDIHTIYNSREKGLHALMKEHILALDLKLIDWYSEASFSEYLTDVESAVHLLAQETLRAPYRKLFQELYYERLDTIPEKVWQQMFESIDESVLNAIMQKVDDFDSFKEIIKGIRDVLKTCLDSGTEMLVYIEGDLLEEEQYRVRTENIYKQLILQYV